MLLHIFNTGNRFSAPEVRLSSVCLIALLLGTDTGIGPALAQVSPSPENRDINVHVEALENGELVSLSAAMRVAAPAETVWKVLVDCKQALEYVPDIRECEVLQSGTDDNGPFDITRHRLKPYFFLPSVNSIFRANYQRPQRIEFYRQGGDLVFFRGHWRFEADSENETVLRYQATVDLHKRLSQRAEMRILRRDIPEMLEKLRELSETRTKSVPDDNE